MRTVVAVSRAAKAEYPSDAPYHPSDAYPEYPFGDAIADGPNYAYTAVRDSFRRLGLDAENFGKANWNPLGNMIAPGMT